MTTRVVSGNIKFSSLDVTVGVDNEFTNSSGAEIGGSFIGRGGGGGPDTSDGGAFVVGVGASGLLFSTDGKNTSEEQDGNLHHDRL